VPFDDVEVARKALIDAGFGAPETAQASHS
jgi:hypothetical protein